MKTRTGSTIKTVGAYEAKTKLPALLPQVERGGEIAISRHHRTIARLALPKGETAKDLINAGRRV